MSRNINEEGTRRRSYAERDLKFETLQLHVGQEAPDPVTDARAVRFTRLRPLYSKIQRTPRRALPCRTRETSMAG